MKKKLFHRCSYDSSFNLILLLLNLDANALVMRLVWAEGKAKAIDASETGLIIRDCLAKFKLIDSSATQPHRPRMLQPTCT
jgi:hypothetical protein